MKRLIRLQVSGHQCLLFILYGRCLTFFSEKKRNSSKQETREEIKEEVKRKRRLA